MPCSNKVLTIMQPAYLPWLGYFERILNCDEFVILDDVEMDKSSRTKFANRNRILRETSKIEWLTLPISKRSKYEIIKNIELNKDIDWVNKHKNLISTSYANCQFFNHLKPFIERFDSNLYQMKLLAVTDIFLKLFLEYFQINKNIIYSSNLGINSTGSQKILDICAVRNCKTYISGPFGRHYLDLNAFHKQGIKVFFHDYVAKEYPQMFDQFSPNLSAIDLIANVGKESHNFLQKLNLN